MKRVREDEGAIAILATFFALVIFVLAAIVVDLGNTRNVKRSTQNAADSAALSAIQAILEGKTTAQAVQVAKDVAQQTAGVAQGDWVGCSDGGALATTPDSANTDTCISFDTTSTQARVRIPPQTVKTNFGGLVGVGSIAVNGQANASVTYPAPCLVCVLGDYHGQNGGLTVYGGSVAINGDIDFNPQGNVTLTSTVGQIGIAGNGLSSNQTHLDPDGVAIPHFSDPYAAMPLPPAGAEAYGATAIDPPAAGGACAPGKTYVTVDNCTSFLPGVYTVVQPSVLAGKGNVTTVAGVVFFFTCSTNTGSNGHPVYVSRACNINEAGGTINDAGTGTFNITGALIPGFGVFALLFDRNNAATYVQVGNGGSHLVGGIYGASITVDNKGTGSAKKLGGLDLDGPLIAKAVNFSGQDTIVDTYTGSAISLKTTPYLVQ